MNGLRVGDGALVGIGSNVIRDVAAGTRVVGNPAERSQRPPPWARASRNETRHEHPGLEHPRHRGCGLVGSTTIDLLLREPRPRPHRHPRRPEPRHARERDRSTSRFARDAGARRHPRPGDGAQGDRRHGLGDPHGDAAHHRVRGRAARGARRDVRRQLQRRRGGAASRA